MSTLLIAIVAIFTSITAPLLLAYFAARQQRMMRSEDYRRQDLVAQRTAEAEAMATAQVAELRDVMMITQARTDGNSEKLDRIHILVNSGMTEARRDVLEQTKMTLAALRKIVAMEMAAGRQPDYNDLKSIAEAKARIIDLHDIIEAREKQQAIHDAIVRENERKDKDG